VSVMVKIVCQGDCGNGYNEMFVDNTITPVCGKLCGRENVFGRRDLDLLLAYTGINGLKSE